MKTFLWLLPLAFAACTSSRPSAVPTAEASAARTSSSATTPVPVATSTSELGSYHWQLHDAVDGNNRRLASLFDDSGKPLQLDFSGDHLSVSHACNGIGGNYKIVDGHLVTGALLQTMMACPDPTLMQRESTIKRVLRASPALTHSNTGGKPVLVLSAADGTTLTFAGQPTAETRYGGPGSIEFLEVAAADADCPQPLPAQKNCLKVRQLHYDAQGLRTGEPGTWRTLTQPIEGYEHQPGMRNVLRVKRYTLTHSPADTSSTAYVLDLVVESEAVTPAA
ncbi:DUF4377 domain-containing protein [Rhodanobacter sp. AS-Z3]|uniref:DUF4377 domain-containing protein n=1 Tax=Rhodanobacter sp. AS-Z3 TaxID=3031330 RepID=UPI002478D945|nr:DUF4377 domain-containing protein [Rhodanobacter sp. AS-Z3]WEN15048.1 DUF4377 domain-containing protein [Rhodanobacter sp. AS-Z3]